MNKQLLRALMIACCLTACTAQGGKVDFHYTVTTAQGGITQELSLKKDSASYYSFSQARAKASEGQFKINNADLTELITLARKIGAYKCGSSNSADNQTIQITFENKTILCSESQLYENEAVNILVQKIRAVIAAQINK